MCNRSIYCSLLVLPIQQHQVGTLWSGEGGRLCFSCFPQAASLFWPQSTVFICIVCSVALYCQFWKAQLVISNLYLFQKYIYLPNLSGCAFQSCTNLCYIIFYFSMSPFTRNIFAIICFPNTVSLEFFGPIQRCVHYFPLCIRVHWIFSNGFFYCIPKFIPCLFRFSSAKHNLKQK